MVGVCFLGAPKTPSQTGLEHLPILLWATCLPQAIIGWEQPPSIPQPSPRCCQGTASTATVHMLQQLPSHIPLPEPPGYQCQDEEHYKLTINRGRRGKAAKE